MIYLPESEHLKSMNFECMHCIGKNKEVLSFMRHQTKITANESKI